MKKYVFIIITFVGIGIFVVTQKFAFNSTQNLNTDENLSEVSALATQPDGDLNKKLPKSEETTKTTTPRQNRPTISKHVKKDTEIKLTKDSLFRDCMKHLQSLPGPKPDIEGVKVVCNQVEVLPGCLSVNSQPIFHYDRLARDKSKEKRILALSLIHGDEGPSGTVARSWMQRLDRLDPRNRWRVIPISNPDGLLAKTRMNVRGVDLNRNFPTEDWSAEALKHWTVEKKSDPRKYPGDGPASEPETQCLISHFKDFDPDFIISIHTPYGVLDFDGPRMTFPKFNPLPWISLGNYPGSLGRFMWVNKEVPVLTIELRGREGLKQLEHFDRLQDISGTVAIQASKLIEMQSTEDSKKN